MKGPSASPCSLPRSPSLPLLVFSGLTRLFMSWRDGAGGSALVRDLAGLSPKTEVSSRIQEDGDWPALSSPLLSSLQD